MSENLKEESFDKELEQNTQSAESCENVDNNSGEDMLDDPIVILEKEKEELKNAYLRLSAETDNYRKRIQQEKESFQKIALKNMMEKLLPVVDNLERSITASKNSDNLESLQEGITLVLQQFEGILKDAGLETVDVKSGDEFDPQSCEAVMMEERDDVEHSMTVVEVFEMGRILGGQVIRTAKVKVAKKI